jgi:hypothetical protein
MAKRMSNLTKDKIKIVGILLVIIWFMSGIIYYIFGEEIKLTDIEKANKYYTEEQIKTEMRWLALKDYVDNMSEEEFIECFYKEEIECH